MKKNERKHVRLIPYLRRSRPRPAVLYFMELGLYGQNNVPIDVCYMLKKLHKFSYQRVSR